MGVMDELDLFNDECIYVHNELRKEHQVPALLYDRNLALEAEKYANQLAERNCLHHSNIEDRENIGENLSQSSKEFVNYVYSALAVSVSWYSEIHDYDFLLEQQTTKKSTNNFTQMVWKETKLVGFGRAKNPLNNSWYIVGRYYPAGNKLGQFKKNVKPLPKRRKWDSIQVVKDYLQELQTIEYTGGRKHILDLYSLSVTVSKDKQGFLIKENFKPPHGEVYHVSQIFKTDVTKEPRPTFVYRERPNDVRQTQNVDPEEYQDEPNEENKILQIVNCIVERHNLYRKNYGVEPLSLDMELSKFALHWASILSSGYFMGYSNYEFNDTPIGENIAMKNTELSIASCIELVDNWYNENKLYFYDVKHESIKEFGHFTQIVWKDTRKIGVGVAINPSGFHYIVCFYYPAGNVRNQFKTMVPRLII